MGSKTIKAECPPDFVQASQKNQQQNLKGQKIFSLYSHPFSEEKATPLMRINKVIQDISIEGIENSTKQALKRIDRLTLPGLDELTYVFTDFSVPRENLLNPTITFIQNGGAVGLISFLSPYTGKVNGELGSFQYTGLKRSYILVMGPYASVKIALNALIAHPSAKNFIQARELAIFNQNKWEQTATFPNESSLKNAQKNVSQQGYPNLFKLKPGVASSVEKQNVGQIEGTPQSYSTYLIADAKQNARGKYVTEGCKTPHLEIDLEQSAETFKLRQVFYYHPLKYTPRVSRVYADRNLHLHSLSDNALKPEEQLTVNIDTDRSFQSLFDTPEKTDADSSTGSPFDEHFLGAFSFEINNLNQMASNKVHSLHLQLFPSKTGEMGSKEDPTEYLSTDIPYQEWNLNDAEFQACRLQPTNKNCSETPGFTSIYHDLLRATFTQPDSKQDRKPIAEFYYFIKRS